jgi:hypothetical protein
VKEILFSDCFCTECNALIGVNRLVAAISSLLILVVAVVTTLIVYLQVGQWAALIWFTAPIGAMSYLKARFGPLRVKTLHALPIAKNSP